MFTCHKNSRVLISPVYNTAHLRTRVFNGTRHRHQEKPRQAGPMQKAPSAAVLKARTVPSSPHASTRNTSRRELTDLSRWQDSVSKETGLIVNAGKNTGTIQMTMLSKNGAFILRKATGSLRDQRPQEHTGRHVPYPLRLLFAKLLALIAEASSYLAAVTGSQESGGVHG